ncbi:MAG: S-layer homology domain-containing protein [Chloroflexi bacterium]|nr:S-layer homology domain-containing protein [Chloroflexota bacterium]
MRRRFTVLLSVIVIALTAAAFSIGRASASTGCFGDTNGHWAETFICWMKDNGITTGTGGGNYSPNNNVTRAEMAVFLARQAEVPPSTGDIVVSAGFANWHPFNSTDPLSYAYFSSQTQVTRSSAGSSFLSVNPDLTTVLYGKSLKLKAVEFCYDTFASTSLNYIEINTYSHTSGSLGRNLRFSDSTSRTGNECRLYTLSTPIVLTKNDGANVFIQVNWSVANASFAIGRTSFIFEPTTLTAAAPVVTGDDGTGTTLSPSTVNTAP